MKRKRCPIRLVAVALVLLAASNLVAQELEESREFVMPLKAEMTGLFTGSLEALHLTADPSVVWNPGFFSMGLAVELLFGMSQYDIYVNPGLLFGLGWFEITGGYILTLARPPEGEGLAGPTVGFALSPEPFEAAYGMLGFELAFDFNILRYVEAFALLAEATAFERYLGSAVLSGRVGLGLSYSFELL